MMDFSMALIKCKMGAKITRSGWNGKGMYVVLKDGYPSVPCNKSHALSHNMEVGESITYLPYLEMKTAGGEFVPWLASQTDILAEDWVVAL